jgi:hypothetical protein
MASRIRTRFFSSTKLSLRYVVLVFLTTQVVELEERIVDEHRAALQVTYSASGYLTAIV